MIGIALALALQAMPAVPPPASPVAATAVDPTQLALAQRLAAKLIPAGSYRTIIQSMNAQFTNDIMDSAMKMPIWSIAGLSGVSPEKAVNLGPTTLKQIALILDPAFNQRTQITMRVMFDGMGDLMIKSEPEYRAGLAEALTARFTGAQLAELDRFFATPTGTLYANQSLSIYSDPSMTRRLRSIQSELVLAMPDLMRKVQDATAGLPKIKGEKDLTAADRAKLEALLGAAKKTP